MYIKESLSEAENKMHASFYHSQESIVIAPSVLVVSVSVLVPGK